MTSWHTCLGSSLAAPRSSRFVILYWTKDGILASLGLSPVFWSPLVWHIMGLKQVSKSDLVHALVFEVVKWSEPFQSKMLVSGSDQTLVVGTNLYLPQQFTSKEGLHRCVAVTINAQLVIIPFFLSLWQLSPKKTWEGFIGGFFATVLFGLLVSSNHGAYFFGLFPM